MEKKMKKRKSAWICRAAVSMAAMAAAVCLGGCGAVETLYSGKGEKEYGKAETMVILTTERLRYENVYSEEIWTAEVDGGGTAFETVLTGQIHDFLKELKVMSLMAREKEITLSSREKELAKTAAGQYMDALGSVQAEEFGLTEEKARESLLRLFRLYADREFDDLAEFLGDGSNPREYAAENYSGQLFLYLKRNMTDVMILEGDDGTGKEPFSMTDELFHYPACMISWKIEELLSDNFTLCLENEIWMLENGEFASVYCVSLTNGTGRLSYRFLDTYIKNTWDIPVSFDDLESSFAKIAEAVEEGRAAELP